VNFPTENSIWRRIESGQREKKSQLPVTGCTGGQNDADEETRNSPHRSARALRKIPAKTVENPSKGERAGSANREHREECCSITLLAETRRRVDGAIRQP